MLEKHEHKHAVHEFDGIIENRVSTPPVYFTVLFYGLIIWGVAFMAFYLLSGWSSDSEFQEKMAAHKGEPVQQAMANEAAKPAEPAQSKTAETPAAVASGQELFSKYCSACHGADGKGGFGPDLSGEYTYGKNIMAVQESITSGRPNNMPAFDKKLSAEEIESLAEFVLSL